MCKRLTSCWLSLFFLLPGQKARLYFPVFLTVRCGHITTFWKCDPKCCATCLGQTHKNSHVCTFMSFPLHLIKNHNVEDGSHTLKDAESLLRRPTLTQNRKTHSEFHMSNKLTSIALSYWDLGTYLLWQLALS